MPIPIFLFFRGGHGNSLNIHTNKIVFQILPFPLSFTTHCSRKITIFWRTKEQQNRGGKVAGKATVFLRSRKCGISPLPRKKWLKVYSGTMLRDFRFSALDGRCFSPYLPTATYSILNGPCFKIVEVSFYRI